MGTGKGAFNTHNGYSNSLAVVGMLGMASPLTLRAGCWSHPSRFPAAPVLSHWKQPSFTSPGSSCQWAAAGDVGGTVTQGDLGPQTGCMGRTGCSSDFLVIHNFCFQRERQRFPLLWHIERFHNESSRKITDGTLSVNRKLPLERKQKAGNPGKWSKHEADSPCLSAPLIFVSPLKAQTWPGACNILSTPSWVPPKLGPTRRPSVSDLWALSPVYLLRWAPFHSFSFILTILLDS